MQWFVVMSALVRLRPGSRPGPEPVRHHWAMGRGQLQTCTTPDSWMVVEVLASLRPDYREVLLETYFRGRSVAEAAATLGIPAGTVKSRAFYALKALKLALEERGLTP
jgi:hypothetical protein